MTDRAGLGSIDHLVWSTPDLDHGIRRIESLTGVRAIPGGSHPGAGTRNAILPLGERRYLEIIAPDPGQAEYRRPRVFRLDDIDEPTLVAWAAHTTDLGDLAGVTFRDGQSLGQASAMSRRRADGLVLEWQLTDPYVETDNGIVPFLIDWGDTPHPATAAPAELALVELQLRHPDPERVREKFAAMKIDLPVEQAAQAQLTAVIDSPLGRIELT